MPGRRPPTGPSRAAADGPPAPPGRGRPLAGRALAIDVLLAVALLAVLQALFVVRVFAGRESNATIAYSLPAANLVEGRGLRVPQLGHQFDLDRFWLLNAPLTAMGQAPLFAAFGARRLADLAGVLILADLNLLALVAIVRRALGLRSWALALALACAFATNLLTLSELSNQRYCTIGFALLALTFLPAGGGGEEEGVVRAPPAWQWLVAGSLPLAHISFAVASAAWLAWHGGRLLRARAVGGRPEVSRWGLAALAVTAVLDAAWYGRVGMVRAQLLPHLSYGHFRTFPPLMGFWGVPARSVYVWPSRAVHVAVMAVAAGVVAACARPSGRRRLGPVLLPAGLLCALLVVDLGRSFFYLYYFLSGTGVVLLFAFRTPRARRSAAVGLGALAAANLGCALWMTAKLRPTFVDTPATVAFLTGQTRPGDRIVIGPPFVLASAARRLPAGRVIPRVVPMPYYLADFDEAAFRREVAGAADVYVGAEAWFTRQLEYSLDPSPPAPIFPGADVRRAVFDGVEVIVARRPAGGSPAP